MNRLLFCNKIHKATVCVLLIMSAVSFSIVSTVSVGSATTEAYESGYDHGCDDARIADPSDRYINQPGKGPSFHTDEFMDGYYDGFYECSTGTNNPDSDYPDNFLDGNVTLGAECQGRALNDGELFQQLCEHQCLYFNNCMNLEGSIQGCYESARNINCDIENGKRYDCPGVGSK
jgi:hypothetical protein